MHARTCVYSCASLGVLCGSTASSTCELEYTQPYGLTQMPIKLCADKHSGTHSGYRTQQPHAHLCVHTGKSPRAAQQIAPFPVLGAPPEQSLALVALCWSRIEGMGTGGGHTARVSIRQMFLWCSLFTDGQLRCGERQSEVTQAAG